MFTKEELEEWLKNIGSGFHKMFNGWNKKYHLKPIIEGDFDYYKITFPKDKSGTTINTTTYTTAKTTTKGVDKEKEILEIIQNNSSLSVEQISGLVNLSIDGVRYHIKNLKKNGRKNKKKNAQDKREILFLGAGLAILFVGSLLLVPKTIITNGSVVNSLAHLIGLVIGFWLPFFVTAYKKVK